MKNTYKRIIPIYWKFHYYQNTSWYKPIGLYKGFTKQLDGHAALLIYKVKTKDVSTIPFYPFDHSIVAKINYLVYKYEYQSIFVLKDKGTVNSRINYYLRRLIEGHVEERVKQDFVYQQFINYLNKLDIDAYMSWIPGADFTKPEFMGGFEKRTAENFGVAENYGLDYKLRDSKATLKLNNKSIVNSLVQALSEFFNYNTYLNEKEDSNKKFVYNLKQANDTPYTQIPATQGDFEGLDYNKMVAWWININNTKRLNYSYVKENCCSFISKALKAGGADKFFIQNHKIWTPFDIAVYAKKLRININKKALKKPKSISLKGSIPDSNNLIWTKDEFYKYSSVSMAHRYKNLIKIDNILKKIHSYKYIEGLKINEPKKLAHDLIEIKNLIAEILYERPNTKRYEALHALLLQCNHVLEMIQDLFYEETSNYQTNYLMKLLDPKSSVIDEKINLAKQQRMLVE